MKKFEVELKVKIVLESRSIEKAISDIKGRILKKERFTDIDDNVAVGYDVVSVREISL